MRLTARDVYVHALGELAGYVATVEIASALDVAVKSLFVMIADLARR